MTETSQHFESSLQGSRTEKSLSSAYRNPPPLIKPINNQSKSFDFHCNVHEKPVAQCDLITEWQAGWNVTNAIQGMFIVSFPFAVLQGGYWAMLAMIFAAVICYYTGMILVDCLYEPIRTEKLSLQDESITDSQKVFEFNHDKTESSSHASQPIHLARVRDTYVDIACHVWGPLAGRIIVTTAQLIELLMTCILYLILCGEMMIGCFPKGSINLTGYIVMSAVVLTPCAFLRSLRAVSWLSFWNTTTHLFINVIVIAYCFSLWAQWQPSVIDFKSNFTKFPISMGIIVFSYTSQIFLPSLEQSMIDRGKFKCMLFWTHTAAAFFKVVFGYIGAATYGENTKEVISNNIESPIFNFALFLKALLSYPLPYYASVQLLENEFKDYLYPKSKEGLDKIKILDNENWQAVGKVDLAGYYQTSDNEKIVSEHFETVKNSQNSCFGGIFSLKSSKIKLQPRVDLDSRLNPLPMWTLVFRVSLVCVTLVLAVTIPHFAILMALIGNFTGTMLSFIWPAYFHLKIKAGKLNLRRKAQDVGVIIIGALSGLVGVYFSTIELYKAMHSHEDLNKTTMPILKVDHNSSCFGNPCEYVLNSSKI